MILQCQACGTKYRLEDSLLKPHGIKVRCSRCGFTWKVYPKGVLALEPLPAKTKKSIFKRIIWVVIAIVVVISFVILYEFWENVFFIFNETFKTLSNFISLIKDFLR